MAREYKPEGKGVALFIVLATIVIVLILATIALNFMSSQATLTQHQVGRIQAYYAALAGMRYAYEQLRSGSQALPARDKSIVFNICSSKGAGCLIVDTDLPRFVSKVEVRIQGEDVAGCNPPSGVPACIKAKAVY
jgi:Tfp pilus assembly protein PilX